MQGKQSGWLINGITILWITVMGLSCANAQDSPAVVEIRSTYTEVNQAIAKCAADGDDFCGYYLNTLQVNAHNGPWPAVGMYQSNEKFWGQMLESEEGEDGEIVLRKVDIDTDRSSRHEHEEFLFDEAGRLIFYFFKLDNGGSVGQEIRYYFKDKKLIDYKEKVSPEEKDFQQYTKAQFNVVLENANRLNTLYHTSFR